MTTKNKKITKPKKDNQKMALIVLSVVTGLLTIAVIIGGFLIFYIWNLQNEQSTNKITQLVMRANEASISTVPIEAQTGKAYIYQARLVLPARSDTTAEVEYMYEPGQEDATEQLYIVNKSGLIRANTKMIAARSLVETFEQAPKLQACSRGYQLSFSQIDDNPNPLIFTKKLSDGRDLYVYADAGCNFNDETFEDYLKQIDSY